MKTLGTLSTLLALIFIAAEAGANTSDIALTSNLNKVFFNVGDTVNLTIAVTNKGPSPSLDGPDIFPPLLGAQFSCGNPESFLSFRSVHCWTGPVGGSQISSDGDVCEFSSIPVGTTFHVTYTFKVTGSASCAPPDYFFASCYSFEDLSQVDPNAANDCSMSVFRIK